MNEEWLREFQARQERINQNWKRIERNARWATLFACAGIAFALVGITFSVLRTLGWL